jgi:2'-5' RNA ligase
LKISCESLPEKIRAFVAVRIPSNTLEQLAAVQERLKQQLENVSWTRAEAMHLTLRFLANVKSAKLPTLTNALRADVRTHKSFELQLVTLGSFSNRVLWVGVGRGGEELTALAETVRDAAKHFGSHEEERPFNAHVTLGRFRERGRGVSAVLKNFPPTLFTPWRVDHVALIRSELSPKGSRYTMLASFSLF